MIDYLNDYRIAYDVYNDKFLWDKYPRNSDWSYQIWDSYNAPYKLDGKTKYYNMQNQWILFLNRQDYNRKTKDGEFLYGRQLMFESSEFAVLPRDLGRVAYRSEGLPIALNDFS